MNFKQLCIAFLFPLVLITFFGFLSSKGLVSSALYIPFAIVVIVVMLKLKRTKNRSAHQNCQSIPEGKYSERIAAFEPLTQELADVGFELADQFYFESTPIVVISAYLHRENGDLFMAYNFGSAISFDCSTEFDNGYSLTTGARLDCGISPRAPKKMLCIEPTKSPTALYKRHLTERTFLASQMAAKCILKENVRSYFASSMKEYYEHTSKIPFFSIRMIFWTVNQRGMVHLKSIQEQIQNGTIRGLNT